MNDLNRVSTTMERLAEVMQETGKKQADLVRDTGLNKSIISRCVSGKTEPGNQTIMLLAKALNVSEMWLWGYDVPKERVAPPKENPAEYDGISEKKRAFLKQVEKMPDSDLARTIEILRLLGVDFEIE